MADLLKAEGLELLLSRHAQGQDPGEDLRYDDTFSKLKNQNAASIPDAPWMIEQAGLLLERSADLRVAMYALHAAAMIGEPTAVVHALKIYSFLFCQRFAQAYPQGESAKIATLNWCTGSYIVAHLQSRQDHYGILDLESLRESLNALHQFTAKNTQDAMQWHDLSQWIEEQLAKRVNVKPAAVTVDQPPQQAETQVVITSSQEGRSLIEQYIRSLLQKKSYEKSINLSRAYRWSDLKIPAEKSGKTALQLRQAMILKVQQALKEENWEQVVYESESLFLQSHGQFFITLNRWTHQALLKMNESLAAETLVMHLKKLFQNYRQLFNFMYNDGQLFCEAQTLEWVESFHKDVSLSIEQPHSSKVELSSLLYQDVNTMKTWIKNNPINNKKDRFIHELLTAKIQASSSKVTDHFPVYQALFERSLTEQVYEWEPELAEAIWLFYVRQLKEAKPVSAQPKHIYQTELEHSLGQIAKLNLGVALDLTNKL